MSRDPAVERRVIDAAKALERCAQYGIPTKHAADAYARAREEQERIREETDQ